jgi:hypothetical protein
MRLIARGAIWVSGFMLLGCNEKTDEKEANPAFTHSQVSGSMEATSTLQRDLVSTDVDKRYDAARTVLKIRPLLKDAVPELAFALETAFRAAVKDMHPDYKESEPVLYRDVVPFGLALCYIGKDAEATILGLMDDRDATVRLATVMSASLWARSSLNYKPNLLHDPWIETLLMKCLVHEDSNVRYHACGGLGDIDGAASEVVAALVAMQEQDPEPKVRQIAEISIGRIKRNQ